MVTMSIPRTPLSMLIEFLIQMRHGLSSLIIYTMVAALLPAKSQRSVTRFPGPKMRLGQRSLASPVHSRVVAWVAVCVSLIVEIGNNSTNLAIRTPGKKQKERPMLRV